MTDPTNGLTLLRVASFLAGLPATLRGEAEGLGREGLSWHPAEGEWCVNEVLGHIIEAERRGFAGQIRRILEQPGRTLPTWDQEQVARERKDCARDGLDLLREFSAEREAGIALMRSLREDQLELSREHPDVGTLRVVDLLHEWVHHDRAHLKQVLSNVQAYVWPHMGNARRFSESE
jgi:hypothetical protein